MTTHNIIADEKQLEENILPSYSHFNQNNSINDHNVCFGLRQASARGFILSALRYYCTLLLFSLINSLICSPYYRLIVICAYYVDHIHW